MTDNEFNLLDELYFVHSFAHLQKELSYDDVVLIETLKVLETQGWVKFLKDVDEGWDHSDLTDDQFRQSYFLATKKGLLAHNS